MTYKIIRLSLFALSRLIWLCIIFFVVVHVVGFFDSSVNQESLNLLLNSQEEITISRLLSQYWPVEILLTLIGFFVFEAFGSKFTYSLAAKISKKLLQGEALEPLDFEIEIQAENSEPGLAAIEINNDAKTPMEFVVNVLEEYFRFDREEAVKLMLEIHTKGSARVQWINAEQAVRVIESISREANKRSYPLVCNMVFA